MVIMTAPILGAGHDDNDNPSSPHRPGVVKSESCIAGHMIEHHSPVPSLPSRTAGSISLPRLKHRTSTTDRAESRETTKTGCGSQDVENSPGRKSSETLQHSYDILHHRSHLTRGYHSERKLAPPTRLLSKREYSSERKLVPPPRLLSRWSSSDRFINDGPPSQPLSCCQSMMSRSSRVHAPVSPPNVRDEGQLPHLTPRPRPRPGLERNSFMWNLGGAGTSTSDRPPLQPRSRRGSTGTDVKRRDTRLLRRSGHATATVPACARWSSSNDGGRILQQGCLIDDDDDDDTEAPEVPRLDGDEESC
jgi:hypothetical protein